DRLAQWGPAPCYLSADAADQASLQRAYDDVRSRFGRIHGVVHAAIELLDKSIAQMDEDRFRQCLVAKVDVSVRIAQVFAAEPLDFVLFFSSLQSFSKAPGQSNYAAGCIFKDAFAQWLSRALPCAVKVMNWGYWGGTGIVASQTYRTRMAQLGIGSIEPAEGMAALERLLGGPLGQLAFIKATRARPAIVGSALLGEPADSQT
ncbi:MAG: KR domain-containing protein, partial [Steroidobacteraceae bacterium]